MRGHGTGRVTAVPATNAVDYGGASERGRGVQSAHGEVPRIHRARGARRNGDCVSRIAWFLPGAVVLGALMGFPLSTWSIEGSSADMLLSPPVRIGAPATPSREPSQSTNEPRAQT